MTSDPDPGTFDQSQPPPAHQYGDAGAPGPVGGPPSEALAGFWIRFGGALIDGILLGIIGNILGALFGWSMTYDLSSGEIVRVTTGGNGLTFLLGAAYFTYFHSTTAGQTIGNRVVGVRVVDADTGGPIPWSRALIRFLMSYVSGFVLLLGFLWMLWDERKQTWHDKVANTLVVRASYYPAPEFGKLPSS